MSLPHKKHLIVLFAFFCLDLKRAGVGDIKRKTWSVIKLPENHRPQGAVMSFVFTILHSRATRRLIQSPL